MTDFIKIFRRCSQLSSLEKVTNKLRYELAEPDLSRMERAAIHRRAEILAGKFFEEGDLSQDLLRFIA